jgi:hypothetical protein
MFGERFVLAKSKLFKKKWLLEVLPTCQKYSCIVTFARSTHANMYSYGKFARSTHANIFLRQNCYSLARSTHACIKKNICPPLPNTSCSSPAQKNITNGTNPIGE